MIRFGPAGIPLSCKGRTLRDGIEDVHTLGLTALEIQLVRANASQRSATEDDVGQNPREIMEELIIELARGTGKRKELAPLDEPIRKGDTIFTMVNPIAYNYTHLKELGQIARNLDVVLSLHTPYYIDLVSNNDLTEASLSSIRWGGILAHEMGAKVIVTHLGMYGDMQKKLATKRISDNMAILQKWYEESKLKVALGVETSGRQEIFGNMEEILEMCEETPGIEPILNFPHIHARGNGALKKKEDFQELFDRCLKFTDGQFYAHFSGVEHEGGNEIRYTPIKKGDLKFEPLAECILDNDYDMIIISGSPLLEHDAMYMKVILERVLSKREAKAERQKKKESKPEVKRKPKIAQKKRTKKEAKKPKKAAKMKPNLKKKTEKKPVKKQRPINVKPKPKKKTPKKPKPSKKKKPKKRGR
jgi:deoxyribonuclease-4